MGIYVFFKHTTIVDVSYKLTVLHWAGGKIACHTCYTYQQVISLFMIIMSCPPTRAGLELDVKNVINILHEAGFADGHWEQLGQQLIKYATLSTIRANRHGDSHLCMSDTISGWLNNDLDKSWEKLAEAVAKLEGYGQATADCVLRKAGIVHKCMFYVRSMYLCANSQQMHSHSMYKRVYMYTTHKRLLSLGAMKSLNREHQKVNGQQILSLCLCIFTLEGQ